MRSTAFTCPGFWEMSYVCKDGDEKKDCHGREENDARAEYGMFFSRFYDRHQCMLENKRDLLQN